MVDVTLLHEHHLFFHLLASDGMSARRIVLVAVHTFHLDGLTIEIIVAPCESELVFLGGGVLNFYFSETYIGREGFHYASLLVFEFAHEGVAVGSLSVPGLHLVAGCEHHLNTFLRTGQELCYGNVYCYAFHQSVFFGVEFVFVERVSKAVVLHLLLVQVVKIGGNLQRSLGVGIIVVGDGHYVAHLYFGF